MRYHDISHAEATQRALRNLMLDGQRLSSKPLYFPKESDTLRTIARPAMDSRIPSYLRRPTPYARERAAAKKAQRQALMRDLLAAALMLAAIAITAVLAAVSAIPEPEHAEAAPIVASVPVEAPKGIPVEATVTAYSSSPDETDDTPFIGASGAHVRPGTLACPARYEFGTKVIIEGETYTCEDRMNPRYRYQERFDVWQPSKEEALNYGTRNLTITVL